MDAHNIIFSYHANLRAEERFPGIDIHQELETAVLFGGQYGNSQAFLCNCGAVVIVQDNEAITVLTKNQYLANQLQGCNHLDFLIKPKNTPTPKKVKAVFQALEKEKQVTIDKAVEHIQLEAIAIEHMQADSERNQFGYMTRKIRHDDLRAKGYHTSARNRYDQIYNKLLTRRKYL